MARRLRLKVWMWMALVAVAAIGMWSWRLKRLSDVYCRNVIIHTKERANHVKMVAYWEAQIRVARHFIAEFEDLRETARSEEDRRLYADMVRMNRGYAADASRRLQTSRAKSDYQVALATKYRRAARYPWLPVAPDPPEPE